MFGFFDNNKKNQQNTQQQAPAQQSAPVEEPYDPCKEYPAIASGLPFGEFRTCNLDIVVNNFAPGTARKLNEARDNTYIIRENQKAIAHNINNLSDNLETTYDEIGINKKILKMYWM